MKSKNSEIKIGHAECSDRDKLETMVRALSECQAMANAMELDTLAYLLEMSVMETRLQIEIDDYS